MSDDIPLKRCTACGESFLATTKFFYREKTQKDGLRIRCKTCDNNRIKSIPTAPEGYKRCTNCKGVFLATTEFFHSQKQGQYGLRGQCKVCREAYNARTEIQEYHRTYNKAYVDDRREELNEKHRAYYYSQEGQAWYKTYRHKAEVMQRHRAYQRSRRNNPVFAERIRARDKYYHSLPENRERARYRAKAWYHNPEKKELRRATQEVYYSKPETRAKLRANSRNRKARKRAVIGQHTAAQIQEQLKRQRYKCYYCSTKFERSEGKYVYHIDHTFPLSRVAGTDIPANDISYLVLACPTCNLSKGDKFPWEFYQGGRLL